MSRAPTPQDVLDASDPERLGTVKDVARLLSVSRSWVYAHRGELPVLNVGGLLRFDLAEVRRWALRQREGEIHRAQSRVLELRRTSPEGSDAA
jgi:excisionase family DNA binding protein